MSRLGVLGWPVAHSRSPAMHNAAFAALGMEDWRYQRLPVPPQLFAETTLALAGSGLHGANVTIPHKQAALALATQASDAAHAIGAANTLTFLPDGEIVAANTDAPGLIAALGRPLHGMTAQVLGAGGSARAAVWALLDAGAAEVAVWNRTYARAEALAGELGGRAVRAPRVADLLINCTSVGLGGPDPGASLELSASEDGGLNQLGLTFDQLGEYSNVADLVYRSQPTPLLAAAGRLGARTVDGLEVLVAQGALSFAMWTGREAPREVMARAARET
jgi:shikimate dehydrogenase